MPRSIPPHRFTHLIEVASRTFIERGYRLTQIADVAEALGVAKGTVYGYDASKEALFDACVRYADGHGAPPAPPTLPVPTPPSGATLAHIRERLATEAAGLLLVRVARGEQVVADARGEVTAVLTDLYDRIARNRVALKLIDRCAVDYPDLARVWFDDGRRAQQQLLAGFIATRADARRLRRVDRPDVVARAILETIAFWAMHRHFDPSPDATDDAAGHAVIEFLAHGLAATA